VLGVKDGRATRPPPAAVWRSLTPARAVIFGMRAIPPTKSETDHERIYFCRPVEAWPVPEAARIGTLPRHFGIHMLTVEGRIYDFLSQFCPSYGGGVWRFHELSNGGFYMRPPEDCYELTVDGNGFSGRLSADAAGITVCLFAFSHRSFLYTTDVFARHYHLLREYAQDHPEAGSIFEAID